MELYYCKPDDISETLLTVDNFETNHIVKTMRKRVGDALDITDGCGNHYQGTISATKPVVNVKINRVIKKGKKGPDVYLGMAFIRPNRLEIVLEKCTELGISTFYLFHSEHANYRTDNHDKFTRILRQAIKQSNRFYLPGIKILPSFKDFLENVQGVKNKLVAVDAHSPSIDSVEKQIDFDYPVLLTIGPEGGFSLQEIKLFSDHNFKDISLGDHRLRSETAAIAGISKLII